MIHAPSICLAPQLLAEELMRLEGFSEVEYVEIKSNLLSREIVEGRADISMMAAPEIIVAIDASERVVVLGGIHAGCYELFGNNQTQRIRDLKGKRVVISGVGSPEHTYVSSILAYVDIDPTKDLGSGPDECGCAARLHGRRGRGISRFPAATTGTARQADRPCHRRYDQRPSVVPVFLLRGGGESRVCRQISCCIQASTSCDAQGS